MRKAKKKLPKQIEWRILKSGVPLADALKEKQTAINKPYTPAPVLTLCGQLEDVIMLLEVRISNSIAKINSLM